MKRHLFIILSSLILIGIATPHAGAGGLNLDSVATWGKFAKFCVDSYRWGDRFFNSYDTAYVQGTGTKFNIKLKEENVLDYYNFNLPDGIRMRMTSDLSTSFGVWLTYLAVSIGYDANFSNRLGFDTPRRNKLSFAINCSLLSAELYYEKNRTAAHIDRFGEWGSGIDPQIYFNNININSWGVETYYFFNHKKYSQAAAFNFSKIQKRSQGSLFAGLSIYSRTYEFDFSSLPDNIKDAMPPSWRDYKYYAKNRNYAIKLGYGYNWVAGRHWLIGISEAPTFGLRKGLINEEDQRWSLGVSNKLQTSAVWNNKRWFIGCVLIADLNLIRDKNHTFTNAIITGNISLGYRFNIW